MGHSACLGLNMFGSDITYTKFNTFTTDFIRKVNRQLFAFTFASVINPTLVSSLVCMYESKKFIYNYNLKIIFIKTLMIIIIIIIIIIKLYLSLTFYILIHNNCS